MISGLFVKIESSYEKAKKDFDQNEQKLLENLNKNDSQKEQLITTMKNDLSEIKKLYNNLNDEIDG